MNLSKEIKVTRVMNGVAAGVTAQNSSSVDMQNFDSVMFVAMFGSITAGAVTSVNAAQSDDDSTFADLAGTGITVADSDGDQVAVIDLERPVGRYVRCEISRATQNAVIDGVLAIQYRGRTKPTTHDVSTVIASELHVSPDEGTA